MPGKLQRLEKHEITEDNSMTRPTLIENIEGDHPMTSPATTPERNDPIATIERSDPMTTIEHKQQEIQQRSQPCYNAVRIKLARGAALGPVKGQVKGLGGWFNEATNEWSCPISEQDQLKQLLKANRISAELQPWTDTHFNKSTNGKKADNLYTAIGIR
jgi:hypothetical protein